MEEDAYEVVMNYTNIMQFAEIKKVYVEEGKIGMCKGLQSWMEREKTEGRAEGRAEGIVKTARKYNATDQEIIVQLMEELGVGVEKAKEYLANADKN